MVLCPYGVGSSLINHGSKENANVKVVWSEKTMVHPEWLEKPIKEWAYDSGAGLCFDYIATRDIAAGEEILLDYGDDWQRAWDEHVATWQPPLKRLTDRLNDDIDGIIPTEAEWQYSMGNPNEDPNAATLWCYNAYRLIQKLPRAKNNAYPCKVILRNDDNTYLAEIVIHVQNEKGDKCEVAFDEALWAVPRDALAYGGQFEVDDTREQWNPKSFRHHIGIPDHLLPAAWRNKVV
jgi:SET domain